MVKLFDKRLKVDEKGLMGKTIRNDLIKRVKRSYPKEFLMINIIA